MLQNKISLMAKNLLRVLGGLFIIRRLPQNILNMIVMEEL